MPQDAFQLATDLGAQLLRAHRKVSAVESCTGGGIAQAITAVAGSSQWFERGFVTYADTAKTEMVGVPRALLDRHGAVSVEVAAAMADGGMTVSGADYCIAVTGVAGPDGGSVDKPVGTVCFGWAAREQQTQTAQLHFTGDRHAVREQSIAHALAGLLALLT